MRLVCACHSRYIASLASPRRTMHSLWLGYETNSQRTYTLLHGSRSPETRRYLNLQRAFMFEQAFKNMNYGIGRSRNPTPGETLSLPCPSTTRVGRAGKASILLTLATGTGKAMIAFQVALKLFRSRWNLSREPTRRPEHPVPRRPQHP